MNKLIDFFARQAILSYVAVVFVFIVGISAALLLRRETFPNIQFDFINITTVLPGGSPEESEKLITNKIETELKEVDGIKKLTSTSSEGRSYVVAQLDSDQTTQNEGKADIQDVVDRITDLPDDAEDPIVTAIESKLTPIIEVSLNGQIPEQELRVIAKNLKKELEKVRGVARVVEQGMRDLEIRVEADLQKMARYRISLDELVSSLASQNVSIPGGTLKTSQNLSEADETLVRTIGEFEGIEDVENTVVRANDLGTPIRVKDIAHVKYDLEKNKIINRTNGKPAIGLTILKKEKADAISLVNRINEKLNELSPRLDQRASYELVNDQSVFIRRRLGVLTNNLGFGLALVIFILAMILPLRVALLVAAGIPFSFFGALIIFNFYGISLNLVSLIGLIIVTGMLVDDAVVVTENSVRLMEEGMAPQEAAIKGTQQVWAPVLASVMTTVLAFAPLMFMSGIFGRFVSFIPLGVILALMISLLECYFILPHHIGRFIRIDKEKRHAKAKGLDRILVKTSRVWDHKIVPFYMSNLKKALKHRYLVALGAIGLVVGSVVFAATVMQIVLFPPEGIDTFVVRVEAPTATSVEKTSMLMRPIEDVLAKLPKSELKNFVARAGLQQLNSNDPASKRGSQYGMVYAYLTPETDRDRSAGDIIESLRKDLGTPPGLTRVTFERINPGPPVGKPISVGVRGEEYSEIMKGVAVLKEIIKEIPGTSDLEDTYLIGKEEIQIKVNQAEAVAAGLSTQSIGTTVRAAFEGIESTSIQRLDEEVQIRVTLPRRDQATAKTLQALEIPNQQGQLIPLHRVAHIKKKQGIAVFEHEDNERQVRILGEIDTKVNSATGVTAEITKKFPELKDKFPRLSFSFGGEDEDTKEGLASLGRAFMLAIFAIFLVLLLVFKDLFQPFLVLLVIPLGVVSCIWTFFFHGWPLTFLGMLGVVALSGVVINNAIVLIDFVNQLRLDGVENTKSIIDAAQMRIRPIFLTSVTTVMGILPTAYGLGGLDKFVVPIALALGWGVFFGSLQALFVFPAALAILDDLKAFFRRKMSRTKSVGARA